MNRDFLTLFMDRTDFPKESCGEVLTCFDLVKENAEADFDSAVKFLYENDCEVKLADPLLAAICEKTGTNIYTVNMLFLIECSIALRELFKSRGYDDSIFWDTMEDVKYKLNECKGMHGVFGNFVSSWYSIFYRGDIVKLGRLEYENFKYDHDEDYFKHGITIKKGDSVKSIHIPSCGTFGEELRLDSYKKAYEFFKDELNGGPLLCTCHSWLLYPQNREILSEKSNIIGFMDDFDIVYGEEEESFSDAWRVFGADCKKPVSELPENSSMQKAVKKWLMSGKKMGAGFGVLIFDGEKLLK